MTTQSSTGDPFLPPAPVMTFATPEGLPLRMRSVTEADLDELHRLDKEVFAEHAYPYFVLRQFFDLFRVDLLVLDDGLAFRGYVLAGTVRDGSRSWILGLAIDRRWRGHGLGRRLMTEILRRLRTAGVGDVRLSVEPANTTAIDLYAALGFSPVGYRKDYFGTGADRLLMELPLAG